MIGSLLGCLAGALLAIFGTYWMVRMQQGRIPADMRASLAACIAAVALGIAALLSGAGLGAGVLAVFAIAGGGAFLALYAGSGQSRTPAAVCTGAPILDFVAADDEGRAFDLAALRGAPFLLKFFRGHWCPYCVAELRRWQEMRPALDEHGVRIVTICSDTAEAIRKGRGKHGLEAIMLPDPDLALTDLYRLRNPKNFAPKPGVIVPLPIPTTILVDAEGIVRWIDQATDYMHRSDPERVLGAVRSMLGVRRSESQKLAKEAKTPSLALRPSVE